MSNLKYPLATEKAVNMISKNNTLVYIVDSRSTKKEIKDEFERVFKVKVSSVHTVRMPYNDKKAFITLSKDSKASDIAMKLKLV
ncbi:50S ribosomal protein L23 [Candidatus Marsarchaeota archaeon]|nr:50S ribosomal protein L23 [Candidatus Marsarchaeota archaeon]MCL5404857.1 50S ribosomal protein L23 [Candidatus Marsarchaeota archaeon]